MVTPSDVSPEAPLIITLLFLLSSINFPQFVVRGGSRFVIERDFCHAVSVINKDRHEFLLDCGLLTGVCRTKI
jgi:hypothetical protein